MQRRRSPGSDVCFMHLLKPEGCAEGCGMANAGRRLHPQRADRAMQPRCSLGMPSGLLRPFCPGCPIPTRTGCCRRSVGWLRACPPIRPSRTTACSFSCGCCRRAPLLLGQWVGWESSKSLHGCRCAVLVAQLPIPPDPPPPPPNAPFLKNTPLAHSGQVPAAFAEISAAQPHSCREMCGVREQQIASYMQVFSPLAPALSLYVSLVIAGLDILQVMGQHKATSVIVASWLQVCPAPPPPPPPPAPLPSPLSWTLTRPPRTTACSFSCNFCNRAPLLFGQNGVDPWLQVHCAHSVFLSHCRS